MAPGVAVYSTTKSAQISLALRFARKLVPRDITVNLVQPGATATDMNPAEGDQGAARPALHDAMPISNANPVLIQGRSIANAV